jgi:soluble lytic murein transglycosylase
MRHSISTLCANKSTSRPLSSAVIIGGSTIAILVALFGAHPALAQNDVSGDVVPLAVQVAPPPAQKSTAPDSMTNVIFQWKSLQQADNFPFASYAGFMVAHPGWPDEAAMRKNAERMIRADGESPALVVNFFRKFPPQSATSHLRFAEALDAIGKKSEALAAARSAWISGSMTVEDETRFMTRFPAALQSGDHDIRMDKLLWARATTNASRQSVLVSPGKRSVFDARLAYLTKAPDAGSKGAAVEGLARNDAGYVADKTFWLRNTNQVPAARMYLSQPRRFETPPSDPVKWLQTIETTAKGAADAGQYDATFAIAKQVELTYAPGAVVRDKSFNERDSYTNITWLAGQTAMTKLNRPNDAIRMFELYGRAARSPQTKAKGLYWAGVAAARAGKREVAASYFTEAGAFFDQFYGQLALDKLGRKPGVPVETTTIAVSGAERDAFERSDVVRATAALGRMGNWQDQTKFVRAIAAHVDTPVDHVLATEFATKIGRQDLALLVGKSAREDDFPGYFKPSWPTIAVPSEQRTNWTMIHAISRQESQFDRQANSRVGARGLMQLMPGTARETASAAGVAYDYASLTNNPQYNVTLGSTYFGKLMSQYNGSYILAVAAYNAGPGNVNKWIRANGDPRSPGVDKITWIEAIPISETRNYVQRVLENAVVYGMLNPNRQAGSATVSLGTYLGTSASSATLSAL